MIFEVDDDIFHLFDKLKNKTIQRYLQIIILNLQKTEEMASKHNW